MKKIILSLFTFLNILLLSNITLAQDVYENPELKHKIKLVTNSIVNIKGVYNEKVNEEILYENGMQHFKVRLNKKDCTLGFFSLYEDLNAITVISENRNINFHGVRLGQNNRIIAQDELADSIVDTWGLINIDPFEVSFDISNLNQELLPISEKEFERCVNAYLDEYEIEMNL